MRREEDLNRHLYVDRYSTRLFLLIMVIILLGVADAFFTLYHVQVHHAIELNPIMKFFLVKGPRIFFYVKYLLTAICLVILCVHKNLGIVKILLLVILSMYVLILINHIYLFFLAA